MESFRFVCVMEEPQMGTDGKEAAKPAISFEVWRLQLRKDCEAQDRLLAFQALGDSVLEILWRRGVEPSVKGLLDGASTRPERSNGR